MADKISINEVSRIAELREDKVSDVLQALVQENWINPDWVDWTEVPDNEDIELPGIDRIE